MAVNTKLDIENLDPFDILTFTVGYTPLLFSCIPIPHLAGTGLLTLYPSDLAPMYIDSRFVAVSKNEFWNAASAYDAFRSELPASNSKNVLPNEDSPKSAKLPSLARNIFRRSFNT